MFTGDNGSGKSALLKAVAVGLVGKDKAGKLQPSFHRWVHQQAHDAAVELALVRVVMDDKIVIAGKNPPARFPVRLVLKNGRKGDPVLEAAVPKGKSKSYSTPDRSVWASEAAGWFSCGYGPFRRIRGASSEAMRQMVAPSTERYVTMFEEAASPAEVDVWMKTLSHKALEGKPDETAQLKVVRAMLNDELMPNGIEVDDVDSDGLWLRDRKGVRLPWGDMSDGYRSALALLADILRHLINAFGVDGLVESNDGKLAVTRSGVVLIDEVDAHLHPEWQREIGFWLKRHFPRIQFLVISHSPLICQAADPNGLFVLPEPGSDDPPRALTQEEYQRVIASKSDTILRSAAFGLLNTRSPLAVQKRAVGDEGASLSVGTREGIAAAHPRALGHREEMGLRAPNEIAESRGVGVAEDGWTDGAMHVLRRFPWVRY